MGYEEDEEDFLEAQEQARVEKLDEQVALAEKKAPEELLEIKASLTKDQFLQVITERAMERMFNRYGNDGLEHQIRKHLHAVVEQQARKILESTVTDMITESVTKIVNEGFAETDSYGQPKGTKKTLASIVIDYLIKDQPDGYGRTKKAVLFAMGEKVVADYLEKELKPHLEDLQKRCKQALDTSVTTRIKEAIVAGLGLRT